MEMERGASLGDILQSALNANKETKMKIRSDLTPQMANSAIRWLYDPNRVGGLFLKIEAIKLARTFFDIGLKEAKDYVENGCRPILYVGNIYEWQRDLGPVQVRLVAIRSEKGLAWVEYVQGGSNHLVSIDALS